MKRLLLCVLIFWGWVGSAQTIYFQDDFEHCDYQASGKYVNIFANKITRNIVHSGNCASIIGIKPGEATTSGFGRLDAWLSQPVRSVWVRAWVYVPNDVPAGQCTAPGQVPGTCILHHVWRLKDKPDQTMQMDGPNVPTHGAIQMFQAGSVQIAREGGRFDDVIGWQCWETFQDLGDPGIANGRMEFYRNGVKLIDSGPVMMRTTNELYGAMDLQSNNDFGGYWVLDDVVVSDTRVGCGAPQKHVKVRGRAVRLIPKP